MLEGLVRKFAVEAEALRKSRAPEVDRAQLEREVLRLLDEGIGRVIREHEWAKGGRERRVAERVHVGLRLEIRRHFASEDH